MIDNFREEAGIGKIITGFPTLDQFNVSVAPLDFVLEKLSNNGERDT